MRKTNSHLPRTGLIFPPHRWMLCCFYLEKVVLSEQECNNSVANAAMSSRPRLGSPDAAKALANHP